MQLAQSTTLPLYIQIKASISRVRIGLLTVTPSKSYPVCSRFWQRHARMQHTLGQVQPHSSIYAAIKSIFVSQPEFHSSRAPVDGMSDFKTATCPNMILIIECMLSFAGEKEVVMAVHTTAILIVSNLLLGILFAIAHHVFYESLNGQVVVDQHQQEWYLRIGTGLSFAVRTLLSASIGSAYVQLIWYNVKYASISINGLDALFGVLSNVWDFAIWELWRTRPVLTIVAVAIWYFKRLSAPVEPD